MTTSFSHIIIVDDDPINNFITKRLIMTISPLADVITFTEPEEGLAYIRSTFAKKNDDKAILLLDINMPTMTGWQFMDLLERDGTLLNGRLLVYILSSSVDDADIEKAKVNPHISDYIRKPLTAEGVRSLA